MRVESTEIPDVKLCMPNRFGDHRGFFTEIYNREVLVNAGITNAFVQDNMSFSVPVGTLRGLHFQLTPFAQAKLVTVITGEIFDAVVDIRRGSPTFGRHVAVTLSATNGHQLFVPAGFAHGFCTTAPDTTVLYKVDAHYSAAHDRGLAWDDPALGIPWPVQSDQATLSPKDTKHPQLADLQDCFL